MSQWFDGAVISTDGGPDGMARRLTLVFTRLAQSLGRDPSYQPSRATATDTTLLVSDFILLVDATSAVTVTLPDPSAVYGRQWKVKIMTGTATVSLTPETGTIEGLSSYGFSGVGRSRDVNAVQDGNLIFQYIVT